MKIAFTHNLQLTKSEEEAEFDSPETVEALTQALVRLGHEVDRVEVTGPASQLVARLEALAPDLVFNTAEGKSGRFREGFYPGLFDQLGIPYTGSDAYVCTLTLDKQLTKMLVQARGILTPRWTFVDRMDDWQPPTFGFPVIVKPNFEGSSKGITEASVVESPSDLAAKVATLLSRYPTGVIIEEYIEGRDVFVPFLEKASPATAGVLTPVDLRVDPRYSARRRFAIYDFELKHSVAPDVVNTRIAAELPGEIVSALVEQSRTIYRVLGIRDLGRLDFRLTRDGQIYFIEANALPSLEPGAGIYKSAALNGLGTIDEVLDAILRSAAERQGVRVSAGRSRRQRKQLRVGLAFNLKRVTPTVNGNDSEAEYDSPKTINAIREAIASHGHEVVQLEATPELPSILPAANVDVVFNIAEGLQGRNREAHVPAILELLGIPYTGSDPATLSLTLDKALAKRIVRQAGINSPRFCLMRTGKERMQRDMTFPLIVKPNAEGSSKGVLGTSVVENESELREKVKEIAGRYGQAALVEEYLPGREFTVALLGENRPRVLPPMEIVFQKPTTARPVYTFEHKLDWTEEIRYDTPAKVDAALLREIERSARGAFIALGCRDVARIDLRLDVAGRVHFIECNPLPGLTPDWSDLCLIAKGAGMDYRTLIGEILAPAIRRYRDLERSRQRQRPAPAPAPEATA